MALSLSDKNYADSRIQLLGRWKSQAFLDYIRPQIMEWTNNMADDMITTLDFMDLGDRSTDKERFDKENHHPIRDGPDMFLGF